MWKDKKEAHVILPMDRLFQLRAAHLLQTGTGQVCYGEAEMEGGET